MACVICFEEFNGELNTPMMCVTCGQTACISCFRKVRKEGPACCKYNLHVAHWLCFEEFNGELNPPMMCVVLSVLSPMEGGEPMEISILCWLQSKGGNLQSNIHGAAMVLVPWHIHMHVAAC